jgi:protocatechuate 3,4-dioxygenase beta subunit
LPYPSSFISFVGAFRRWSGTGEATRDARCYTGLTVSALLMLCLGVAISAQERQVVIRPGTARLAGTVIDAETGAPLRSVDVVLTGADATREASTDGHGRFTFDRLSTGGYTLSVSRPGYLKTTYGQQRPGTNTPGRRIQIADGQRIDDIRVPLTHGGSLSGVVRDPYGDPVYGADVLVLRWRIHEGRPLLATVAATKTDERGMYRVPLLPQRGYVVRAVRDDPSGRSVTAGIAAPAAFFPSAISAAEAALVELGHAEHRSGIDVQLREVRLSRLRGVVVDATGRPISDIPVSIIGTHSDFGGMGMNTDANGRFVMEGLAPGTYELRASGATVKFEGGAVTVRGEEIAIVSGRLDQSGRLGGTTVQNAIEEARRRAIFGEARTDVTISEDETVDIVLAMNDVPASAAASTSRPAPSAEIGGDLTDAQGRALAGRTVLLFPQDEQRWGAYAQFIRRAVANEDGGYIFANVAPGVYRVALTTEIESDEWLDLRALKTLLASSVAVTLAPGERSRFDLRAR